MSAQPVAVTAIYRNGSRHALTVTADSVYRAVFAFNHEVVCGLARHIPRPEMDTRFEVTVDGQTYETDFRRAMEWANRQGRN